MWMRTSRFCIQSSIKSSPRLRIIHSSHIYQTHQANRLGIVLGSIPVIQELLHLLYVSCLSRGSDYDLELGDVRERVHQHRCHLFHLSDLDRTPDGGSRNHHLVRWLGSLISISSLLWLRKDTCASLWQASIYDCSRSVDFAALPHQYGLFTRIFWSVSPSNLIVVDDYHISFVESLETDNSFDLTHSDLSFVLTVSFLWRVSLITAVSSVPLYIAKALRSYFAPASYAKWVDLFLFFLLTVFLTACWGLWWEIRLTLVFVFWLIDWFCLYVYQVERVLKVYYTPAFDQPCFSSMILFLCFVVIVVVMNQVTPFFFSFFYKWLGQKPNPPTYI